MCDLSQECSCQIQNPIIQSAIGIVQAQHYISFDALCRRVGIAADAKKGFLADLRTECHNCNSAIGEIDGGEAERAFLQSQIFYSRKWAEMALGPQAIGLKIGCDIYDKILENNWNNYGRSCQVNNARLDEAYLDHVIKWQMGFIGCCYAWDEFCRFYRDLTEFECELGDDEIITSNIPGVDADALKDIDSTGIIRTNVDVNSGDLLVGKVRVHGESRTLFNDTEARISDVSLRVPPGMSGRVSKVQIERRRGQAGNYGNVERNIRNILETRLSSLLLGERLTVEIVDSETQQCLVPANRMITSGVIKRIAKRRDYISINDANIMARLETVFREFRPYFKTIATDVARIKVVRIALKIKEVQ